MVAELGRGSAHVLVPKFVCTVYIDRLKGFASGAFRRLRVRK